METSILFIWIGALLIVCGILYGAAQVLWRGRLSDAHHSGALREDASLEPQESTSSFSFRTHWPAFVLILLGSILIFTRTLF